MPTKDQQIADDMIARGIDMLRFAAGERAKVYRILQRLEDDLVELLFYSGKRLSDISRADKARLLRQAQEAITQYYGEASDQMAVSLDGLGRLEAEQMAASLEAAFASAIVPSLPTEGTFKRLIDDTLIQGAPSSAWWKRQAGDVSFRFSTEVAQGIAQAETNDQIIRRIRGEAVGWKMVDGKRVYQFAGGVMETARRNAAALVQTSVQTVANAASLDTLRANEEILKGYKQLSTLDGHTSPTCVAYSGAQWNLKLEPIAPTELPFRNPGGSASGTPRHWNCRSRIQPMTKTFRELGIDIDEPAESTRSSVDGQIAAGTTFDAFLRRKGKQFADDLLGPGRAELWREKKITLQQLLDQSGRPLSLEELRRKYDR